MKCSYCARPWLGKADNCTGCGAPEEFALSPIEEPENAEFWPWRGVLASLTIISAVLGVSAAAFQMQYQYRERLEIFQERVRINHERTEYLLQQLRRKQERE